MKVWNWNVKMH